MVEKDAKLLAEKYRKGQCSPEELALIESWYVQLKVEAGAPDHDQIVSSMVEVWAALNVDTRPAVRLWPRITVAAAAVAAIVVGVWFYTSRHLEGSVATRDLLVNDIAPGRNGATITLASGEVIALSAEKKGVVIGSDLKYDDNTLVINSTSSSRPLGRDLLNSTDKRSLPKGRDDGRVDGKGERQMVQTLTAETKKGQTYEFTLPDGTHVWLNADSRISFPSQFNGKERKILLSGEAYFAVVHNAKQPFRVVSNGQVVEDIGTEFNINAYGDESNTKTTLVEGSARVNEVTLSPSQQAVLTGNAIQVKTVNTLTVVDWKKGEFRFKNEALPSIMRKIARWYDVDVVYEGKQPEGTTFSGSVSRYDKVSAVLHLLEEAGDVQFKIEGRTIRVQQQK